MSLDIRVEFNKYKRSYLKTATVFETSMRAVARRLSDTEDDHERHLSALNEEMLDLAETALMSAVCKGSFPAVKFLLENKGSSRGYGLAATTNADPLNLVSLTEERLKVEATHAGI